MRPEQKVHAQVMKAAPEGWQLDDVLAVVRMAGVVEAARFVLRREKAVGEMVGDEGIGYADAVLAPIAEAIAVLDGSPVALSGVSTTHRTTEGK